MDGGQGTVEDLIGATDRAGNVITQPFSVLRDVTAPAITITVPSLAGLSIPVAWPASDDLSGLRSYQVQVKVNNGPWTNWFTETTATQATFVGSKGYTYTFQVKATDKVNNTNDDWVVSGPVFVGATVKKYYHFNGQRIALRQGDEVYYLYGDHLGSTSLTTDESGNVVSEVRYLPYGQERWSNGPALTDFGFTSQRNEVGFGLYDYNARYYSPVVERFISPDSIIPDPTSSGGFYRYRYARNNPLKYVDPSGHQECEDDEDCNPLLPPQDPFEEPLPEWREKVASALSYGAVGLDGVAVVYSGVEMVVFDAVTLVVVGGEIASGGGIPAVAPTLGLMAGVDFSWLVILRQLCPKL